jgi:Cu/Ag efflux protein CusF
MSRRLLPCLMLVLLAATSARAQMGGGGAGGGGGGGHGHGGHRGSQPSSDSSSPAPANAPIPREKPANQIEIVGVVQAIAPGTDRVTIAYEPVDELGWPKGTMPFPVSKPDLLKGVTVGEKVRFRLDSEQIADLKPF